MKPTGFAGALVAIAIGAVFAFAVHASPRDLDLQEAGLVVMLGGVADLLVRFAVPGGPLPSDQAAEVEAGLEPGLDPQGNPVYQPAGYPVTSTYPVSPSNPPDLPRPPLIAPLPGTLPGVPRRIVVDPSPYAQEITIPESGGGYPAQAAQYEYEPAEPVGPVVETGGPVVVADPAQADTPQAPQAVRTLGGRPVRPRGRWAKRRGL